MLVFFNVVIIYDMVYYMYLLSPDKLVWVGPNGYLNK